ncbi:mCG142086, isoform CRA_c [Mus musculus]|nr:mCG142086, isoform CRA_c [Mus musculus]EDL21818.1 mCG142086, isoform CRA_c [Mus musculus]
MCREIQPIGDPSHSLCLFRLSPPSRCLQVCSSFCSHPPLCEASRTASADKNWEG